jgi:hypothetical protein
MLFHSSHNRSVFSTFKMDDIPMMDESPESTPQQQRFNIADVLGGTSHSDSSSFFSDMAEPDERIVRDRLRALYPYLDEKVPVFCAAL